MDSAGFWDVFARLGAATLLGAIIGLNRQMKHKPAGLRTHALVSLGAAVMVALVLWNGGANTQAHTDALSRAVQGILTGIGFLGAGVIMRSPTGQTVRGLTTAASIWLAACVGAACGAAAWSIGLASFVLVMLVLLTGGPLERWVIKRRHAGHEEEGEL